MSLALRIFDKEYKCQKDRKTYQNEQSESGAQEEHEYCYKYDIKDIYYRVYNSVCKGVRYVVYIVNNTNKNLAVRSRIIIRKRKLLKMFKEVCPYFENNILTDLGHYKSANATQIRAYDY